MDWESEPRQIKSVAKATMILQTLSSLNIAGVTEISNRTNLSKTTAYHHLETLRSGGLVTKIGDKYRLSLSVFELGGKVRNHFAFYQEGKSEVDELADRCGEYVNLVVEEDGLGFIIYKQVGDKQSATSTSIGQSVPLLNTGAGRAILATMSDEQIQIFSSNTDFESLTERSITDEEQLFEELSTVREYGYAVLDEEYVRGAAVVAAPVVDKLHNLHGAVSISGPTSRIFTTDKGMKYQRVSSELTDHVLETANLIEMNINMHSEVS